MGEYSTFKTPAHYTTYTDRRSFNYKLKCSCGWESKLHLMEKDALAEAREHIRTMVKGQ